MRYQQQEKLLFHSETISWCEEAGWKRRHFRYRKFWSRTVWLSRWLLPSSWRTVTSHGVCYCRNRVSSCNITYVVQQDTQLLLWLNIYSQYVRQLDMFRTYRSILRNIYEGWNFNFGNTPVDWIQELLEWRANAAGRMGPSPTYIHNGSGPSRNGHTQ